MITLITGSPGSGKTLYCVDKILSAIIGTTVKIKDDNGHEQEITRPILANINGLLIDHEKIDSDWLLEIESNKQTGAFIVFDEVQRVWPNRPPASKKPPSVQYLETHRHDGIDLVLLTQNPQLLDPAVRALVGRHLHIRRLGGMGAAVVYEWDGTSNGLNFKQAFAKHPYKYNKKAFKLYKSAEIHTKQKRKLPFAVYIAAAGVVGAAFMWPRFSANILNKQLPEHAQVTAPAPAPAPAPARVVPSTVQPRSINAGEFVGSMSADPAKKQLTAKDYQESLKPRHPARPWTAPRYDAITQPVRAPYPAACIESKTRGCLCYSQQGTPLMVPPSACETYVKTGVFIDFEPERQRDKTPTRQASPGSVDANLLSTDPRPPIALPLSDYQPRKPLT